VFISSPSQIGSHALKECWKLNGGGCEGARLHIAVGVPKSVFNKWLGRGSELHKRGALASSGFKTVRFAEPDAPGVLAAFEPVLRLGFPELSQAVRALSVRVGAVRQLCAL
jgi:hypothetical protein